MIYEKPKSKEIVLYGQQEFLTVSAKTTIPVDRTKPATGYSESKQMGNFPWTEEK